MGESEREKEQLRRAKTRLRRIQHYEQVTRNVSQTCRFFSGSPVVSSTSGCYGTGESGFPASGPESVGRATTPSRRRRTWWP